MYLDAADGNGCDHCEVGYPITYVQTRSGLIKKCLECTLYWFGWSIGQFEVFHRQFRDHIGDALQRAIDRDLELARQLAMSERA